MSIEQDLDALLLFVQRLLLFHGAMPRSQQPLFDYEERNREIPGDISVFEQLNRG
jgi:hypothetical protein